MIRDGIGPRLKLPSYQHPCGNAYSVTKGSSSCALWQSVLTRVSGRSP